MFLCIDCRFLFWFRCFFLFFRCSFVVVGWSLVGWLLLVCSRSLFVVGCGLFGVCGIVCVLLCCLCVVGLCVVSYSLSVV